MQAKFKFSDGMVANALFADCLVAELALTSQGWTMLLPLVVDKAGMVQCSEATALCSAKISNVGCLPCFTTVLLLILLRFSSASLMSFMWLHSFRILPLFSLWSCVIVF